MREQARSRARKVLHEHFRRHLDPNSNDFQDTLVLEEVEPARPSTNGIIFVAGALRP